MTDNHDEHEEDQSRMNQDDLHSVTAPEQSEEVGVHARPEDGYAEVTHYAYDPQTYEILCRPGQRLGQRKAGRLQELGLYAHVVAFAE